MHLKNGKNETNNNIVELQDKSSERLEFLGDTVIKCSVSKYIYLRYFNEDEGFLTRIKTKIENRKSLATFAKKLGIDRYIILSQQIELNNGRESDKLLEDCFEAFMGALFLDQGFDICDKFLMILLETEIDYSEILYKDTNFKDKLLRFFHQNNWSHPIYEDVGTEIINNKKYFTVLVKNKLNEVLAKGQELSKKKAEQKVAMLTLIKFNQLYCDQIVDVFDT
jgi:ribonuclease-3